MKMKIRTLCALVLSFAAATHADALCPRPTDCEKPPLAVQDEYALRIVESLEGREELLFTRIGGTGIEIRDVDRPGRSLLLVDAESRVLGAGKSLAEKRAAVQALIDGVATIEIFEPNHYVFGTATGQCVAGHPADAARELIGLTKVPLANTTDTLAVVAVLDSGTQVTHPSLRGRLWTNAGEKPGNVDHDGNLIKGDVYGAAFENGHDLGDVASNSSHGMSAAGIVTADNGNGPGGIAPYARIMSLRFLDQNNVGKTWDAARAIDYAVKKGADVINMSWASLCIDTQLETAVKNAAGKPGKGVLLVSAAGNHSGLYDDDNDTCRLYPASYAVATMITVGATRSDNGCARVDTRFGRKTTHISAPGNGVWTLDRNDQCVQFDGTSAATPIVAGTAALLAGFTPGWTWKARRQYLLDSALPPPNAACGLASATGRIVNAANATSARVTIRRPSFGERVSATRPVSVDWDIAFDSTECKKFDIYYANDGKSFVHAATGVPIKPTKTTIKVPIGATTEAKIRMACQDTRLYAESPPFEVQ